LLFLLCWGIIWRACDEQVLPKYLLILQTMEVEKC